MAKFYHIDRTNFLNTLLDNGIKDINLKIYNDITCINANLPLQEIVSEMFPEGVSSHGNAYFLNKPYLLVTSADIELTFELVRRYKYPNKISRFQSFFAIDKDMLVPMLHRLQSELATINIYEVESEIYSKHDMNLLIKGDNLVSVALANLYWEGKSIGEPLYEYLLKPPVRILRKVPISELI